MSNFKVGVNGPYMNKELLNKTPMTKEIKLSGTDRLEIMMGKFEEFLDYSGGVPVVSTTTGTLRFVYGTIQLLSAFALKTIGIFGASLAERKNMGKWEKFNHRASYHMLEGIKNMGRGATEALPLINLFWWFHIPFRDDIEKVDKNTYSQGPGGCYRTSVYEEARNFPNNPNPTMVTVQASYGRSYYHGELKRMHILNQLSAEQE